MKTILKPYTKKETKEIYRLWYDSNATTKEREEYAISIGRTFTQCSSKASYERNIRKTKTLRRPYITLDKKLEKHATEVKVTHVIKPPMRAAIINIGLVRVEIPSNSFSVDGVKFEW